VIEASSVSKSYGDKLLFDNLNFSLPPAGIVGIIGPNGAGKTTLRDEALRVFPQLEKVITATTRNPRQGEVHGIELSLLKYGRVSETRR